MAPVALATLALRWGVVCCDEAPGLEAPGLEAPGLTCPTRFVGDVEGRPRRVRLGVYVVSRRSDARAREAIRETQGGKRGLQCHFKLRI